jgi:7-cyano-7-deazaguanine synthase in queuosine biosynthesis
MKHLVMWSGGSDSTYLLNRLLKDSTKNEPVCALSIIWGTSLKDKSESIARKHLSEEFKKRGYHLIYKEVKLNSTGFASDTHNAQPIMWLTTLFQNIQNDAIVHFGYNFSDSFWHIKGKFVKAFYALVNIRDITPPDIKLCFDLEWEYKKNIIKRLKRERLLKYIWTCEFPKKVGVPCHKCDKCKEK